MQEARQAMESFAPDCMVVDWMLPDGSGIELIRWLRRNAQFQQIPILMLTARAAKRPDHRPGRHIKAIDKLEI